MISNSVDFDFKTMFNDCQREPTLIWAAIFSPHSILFPGISITIRIQNGHDDKVERYLAENGLLDQVHGRGDGDPLPRMGARIDPDEPRVRRIVQYLDRLDGLMLVSGSDGEHGHAGSARLDFIQEFVHLCQRVVSVEHK